MNFRTKTLAICLAVLTFAAPISAAEDAERHMIAEREIEQVAYFNRLEFLVQEMRVNDLDAELEPEQRPRGVELIFPARVFNTTRATAQPGNVRPTLQWTDPATGDSFAVNGQADFSAVPGEARTSGEFRFHVSPRDRERFDEHSAHLVFGQLGRTSAVVAIGADVEGHSRLPIPQATEGWAFVVEGENPRLRRSYEDTVTITRAEVMWMHGNTPLEDGTSLLELTYTIENNSTGQTCSQRSEGGWRLTLPNGDAVTDLRVSERCVAQGDRVEGIMTGFLIPTEDFAGEYVLAHRRGEGSDSDPWGEVEISLKAGEGTVFLDRR